MKRWRKANPALAAAINRENLARRRRLLPGHVRSLARTWWAKQAKLKSNAFLALRLRTRIRQALKGQNKSATLVELIGCKVEYFRKHIEAQFKPGMSWENYGLWHIDHGKPCAKFNLTNPEEQRQCFHFSNLQPLWAKDNLAKRALP